MSYINKSIAENTAFNMLKSTRDKIIKKEIELSDYCQKIVLESIPKELASMIDAFPDGWLQPHQQFRFQCEYEGKYCSTTTRIRYKYGSNPHIKVSAEVYEKIKSLSDEIYSMREKEGKIKETIVSTLLKLRTSERIKKEFPEAFKNMPKEAQSSVNAVALPIDKILSSIDEFPK